MVLTAYCPKLNQLLRTMKLTTIMILVGLLQVNANGNAQSVTLSVKNTPLVKVFQSIEKQTGYLFWYDHQLLEKARPITVTLKNSPLETALYECFKGQPFTYEVVNKTVVLQLKKDHVSPIPIATSPVIPIRGHVINDNGAPLAGATVSVKGRNQSTATDQNGYFEFADISGTAILQVSNIGYEAQEVQISGRSNASITIILKRSINKLDEVKVIGYGTTTQRQSTGNISKVSSDVIAQQPVTNPLQALSGRVAGLQVIQANGLPGAPISVQIRGRNSIAAGNEPLYVIDGVPFTAAAVERLGGTNGGASMGVGSPMNTIAPSDIESIEVLKDADATAIYGSRAANGVILVTTKKGKLGKTSLDLNISRGGGTVTRVANALNTAEYIKVRKDALQNSGLPINVTNAADLVSWDTTQYTDWQDWFIGNTANITEAAINLTGGTQQLNYLLSGAYHDETTILPGDNKFGRANVHLSLRQLSSDKKFSLQLNSFYTSSNSRLSGSINGPLINIDRNIPHYPIYTSQGAYNWISNRPNQIAELNSYRKTKLENLNVSLALQYKILPALIIKANLGYNKINSDQVGVSPITSQDPATNPTGNSAFANQYVQTYLFEPLLTYTNMLAKGRIELLAGSTIQQNKTRGQTVGLSGYTNDLLLESMNYGIVGNRSSTSTDYRYMSLFGRLNYNWHNKYILNLNFRRDGSSRFGPGKQFGNFGSIGAAWLFSNESFINNTLPIVSYGKLRVSYGTAGNDGIGDYRYLNLYASTPVNYGSMQAIAPSQIANPVFQWEVNKKLEAAIELGFLQDRFLLNLSWYRNRCGNQLVGYALPSITGFTSYTANLPAVVENTGIEIDLTTTNIQSGGFKWGTYLNLSIPRNKLLSYPGIEGSSYANTYVVGKSLSIVQRFNYEGVDPQTGLTAITDVNRDGVFTQKSFYNGQGGDYVIAGQTAPDWFGGLGNTVTYKGFELNFLFQYTKQQGYNVYGSSYSVFGRIFNGYQYYLDYWKEPGDKTVLPKVFAGSNTSQSQFTNSSAGISDASFLRLKNVSISYSFPQKWLQAVKMTTGSIYLQGQNLLTATNFKGHDPETAGNSTLMIPPLKFISLGIRCSF